jgi:exosortase D (VPLPA-CTERM-specific)
VIIFYAMRNFFSIKYVDLVKTLLIGLLLAGIYYSSYSFMISWWQRDDYNYCYLIPFVVMYLLMERRHYFFKLPSTPEWGGLIPVVLGLVLFWIGELGGEYYSLYLSSWLVVVGLIWMYMGWQRLKAILFPLFYLITMFPPPNFIYNNLSLKLKLISSRISVAIIQAVGMAAYREGNVIDLGFTKLQVVDACSGLRYLVPLVVLSLLVAYFYKDDWWKRIVLVLSAIPISILVNGLRIVSVALLYPIWGPKVAEGFFHDFSGWLIFMVSVGILLFETWILRKVGKPYVIPADKASDHSSRPEHNMVKNDLGFIQPHFIVAVLLLGITLVLSHTIEFREKVPISKSFADFPVRVGEWIGQPEAMEQKFIDALDLSDYIIMNYRNPEGETVNFYVAYYESQRKGESIHSPESCLPGAGWVFQRSGTATLPLFNHNPSEIKINRALMQNGGYRQLCYFWFPQRGRILTKLYQLKLYNFWDALTRHRTDGALVRLITPVGDVETAGAAEKRLQGFAREIVPVLDGFLPK